VGANWKSFVQKKAKTLREQGTETHNEIMSISAILLERRQAMLLMQQKIQE
jgi:hypothetical protein